MTGHGGSSRPAADLVVGLWRAAFIGFLLVLFSGTSWLLIRAREGSPAQPGDNPMRSQCASIWQSVAEGQSEADVIRRMGAPDEQRKQFERIADCAGTCDTPCDRFHTCVQEYEWASAPEPEWASIYLVCVDARGIVRRRSSGMRFNLRSDTGGYGLADVVAWGVGGLVFALPVAAGLLVKRRLWPRRWIGLR
jgi:hypothetical protein